MCAFRLALFVQIQIRICEYDFLDKLINGYPLGFLSNFVEKTTKRAAKSAGTSADMR